MASPKCGVLRRSTRIPCGQPAGKGTNHLGFGPCDDHGGNLETVAMRAADNRANAELAKLGMPLNINPAKALLGLVQEAAGNVAYYRTKVQELGDALTVPDRIKTEETKAVLRLYNEERDRLAKFSKLCVEVGVSERLMRIEMQQAENMTAIIRVIIKKMELGPVKELEALQNARQEFMNLAAREVIDMPQGPMTLSPSKTHPDNDKAGRPKAANHG